MGEENAADIATPLVKAVTAMASGLAAMGINTWGDAAALLAFVYSFCLLMEFWWKRVWRPFFESCGWIKRRPQWWER